MAGNLRFRKEERLTRKKSIDQLFKTGKSFTSFPLKILFTPGPFANKTHQVLISVPSRSFSKAVHRNLLKRRIREGYRLSKSLLPSPPAFCLAYIYVAKEILPSQKIHEAIKASLRRLNHHEQMD